MAQKRMFDKAVIDTDRFMDLPMSSKALYFLLGMEADDEGFVSYKKVVRIHGGSEDDVKILVAKNFIIQFQNGVVVITDWRKNNWLDSRRIKGTEYITEKELLAVTKDNQYKLSHGLADAEPEESRGEQRSVEDMSEKSDVTVERFEAFDYFWAAYPKKELKKKSREIWLRKKLDAKKEMIMEFIATAKNTDRWKKGFVKQPPAFLNGECWNDDIVSYNDKSFNSKVAIIS